MTRTPLPRLHPGDLTVEQRTLYDAIAGGPRARAAATVPVVAADGTLEGPFNALLYAPQLGTALEQVGARLRYASVLSDRERELATLYAAARLDSAYERWAHRRLGAVAGLTAAEVDAAAAGRIPADLAGRERAVLDFADTLLDGTDPPAGAELDDHAVVELTVLVGYYRLLADVLRVAGVGAPDS